MSEVNLKEFKFDEKLLENVRLFDEVLKNLGEPPLFENPHFKVFAGYSVYPNYFVMETSNQKSNTLPIMIWFERDDLRIDIDNIPETFEWPQRQLVEERDKTVKFIENLLTGFVLIDYRIYSGRFVQIFDANGHFMFSFSRNVLFHFCGRFLLRQKDYRRLYLPLFTKTK